jgi:hypothetical protein
MFDLDGVLLNSSEANNAGINCYLVLNTPLIRSDFDGLISQDKIFERIGPLRNVLQK